MQYPLRFLLIPAGALLLSAPVEAFSPGDSASRSPCLERIREQASPGTDLAVTGRDGSVVRGRLVRLESEPDRLALKTFDAPDARYTVREIPIATIDRIRGRTEHASLAPAVFGAVLLGSLAFAAGYSIADDPDFGTAGERTGLAMGLGAAGAWTGFVIGGMLTPRTATGWEVRCAGPTGDR